MTTVSTRTPVGTAEAARRLKLTPQALRRWTCGASRGPIKPTRIAGRLLCALSAVELAAGHQSRKTNA